MEAVNKGMAGRNPTATIQALSAIFVQDNGPALTLLSSGGVLIEILCNELIIQSSIVKISQFGTGRGVV
jgi:hypothetical protein